jgi:GntR family transcriptional regulator
MKFLVCKVNQICYWTVIRSGASLWLTMPTKLQQTVERGAGNPVLQVYEILSAALHRRTFPANERLPGERALAEQLGVSRATVRQVLMALARSGLVRAAPNRGWYVTTNRLSEGPNILSSFSDSARELGLTPTTAVHRQQVRAATLGEANRLRLPPAAPVVELERLRGMDGIPIAIDHSCLPTILVPSLDTADLADRSLHEVLADRYGLTATRCDYEVQAQAASERVGELLRLDPGAPVLVGEYTTYDQEERPIYCGRISYRGDAYRFKASLFRF